MTASMPRGASPADSSSRERRLRVIQLVLSLSPGGTERLVLEICKRLRPHADTLVCCLDEEGAWAGELRQLDIPIETLGRTPGFHPSLGRRIAEIAARHRSDVIHCHHYSPFVYGRIAALWRPRLGIVFTEHGRLSDAGPSAKRRWVNPLLGRLAGGIFAVSENLRRHMVAEGFPSDRVRVIYNGIAPGPVLSAHDRHAARALLGVPDDAFLVGTVGRLDPVKDLPTLVRAFASVRQRLPQCRLTIIGSGPERRSLEQIADAAGVRPFLQLAGYRDNVRALLPAFDVYANTSTHEGVSLTILEAMAAGLPVVATAVGGNPEVVADNTGILVPGRSPGAVASAMVALARDPDRRAAMGASGRMRVKRLFTLDRMVEQYLHAYMGDASSAAMVEGLWPHENA